MPNHKFKESDLEVYENFPLSGHYHILVVGTFNPDIGKNEAGWFYGRKENEFWCLLPRMRGHSTLHPVDRDENYDILINRWKEYCVSERIIIVDIFKSVTANLKDYKDFDFYKLQEHEYISFDYEKAFANATFDFILFTWKGLQSNVVTTIKKKYEEYFASKKSTIMHMITPSAAYRKSRSFKLEKWKEEYNKKDISLLP